MNDNDDNDNSMVVEVVVISQQLQQQQQYDYHNHNDTNNDKNNNDDDDDGENDAAGSSLGDDDDNDKDDCTKHIHNDNNNHINSINHDYNNNDTQQQQQQQQQYHFDKSFMTCGSNTTATTLPCSFTTTTPETSFLSTTTTMIVSDNEYDDHDDHDHDDNHDDHDDHDNVINNDDSILIIDNDCSLVVYKDDDIIDGDDNDDNDRFKTSSSSLPVVVHNNKGVNHHHHQHNDDSNNINEDIIICFNNKNNNNNMNININNNNKHLYERSDLCGDNNTNSKFNMNNDIEISIIHNTMSHNNDDNDQDIIIIKNDEYIINNDNNNNQNGITIILKDDNNNEQQQQSLLSQQQQPSLLSTSILSSSTRSMTPPVPVGTWNKHQSILNIADDDDDEEDDDDDEEDDDDDDDDDEGYYDVNDKRQQQQKEHFPLMLLLSPRMTTTSLFQEVEVEVEQIYNPKMTTYSKKMIDNNNNNNNNNRNNNNKDDDNDTIATTNCCNNSVSKKRSLRRSNNNKKTSSTSLSTKKITFTTASSSSNATTKINRSNNNNHTMKGNPCNLFLKDTTTTPRTTNRTRYHHHDSNTTRNNNNNNILLYEPTTPDIIHQPIEYIIVPPTPPSLLFHNNNNAMMTNYNNNNVINNNMNHNVDDHHSSINMKNNTYADNNHNNNNMNNNNSNNNNNDVGITGGGRNSSGGGGFVEKVMDRFVEGLFCVNRTTKIAEGCGNQTNTNNNRFFDNTKKIHERIDHHLVCFNNNNSNKHNNSPQQRKMIITNKKKKKKVMTPTMLSVIASTNDEEEEEVILKNANETETTTNELNIDSSSHFVLYPPIDATNENTISSTMPIPPFRLMMSPPSSLTQQHHPTEYLHSRTPIFNNDDDIDIHSLRTDNVATTSLLHYNCNIHLPTIPSSPTITDPISSPSLRLKSLSQPSSVLLSSHHLHNDAIIQPTSTSTINASPNTTGIPTINRSTSQSNICHGYRTLLVHDILSLLGCINLPEQIEMDHIWLPCHKTNICAGNSVTTCQSNSMMTPMTTETTVIPSTSTTSANSASSTPSKDDVSSSTSFFLQYCLQNPDIAMNQFCSDVLPFHALVSRTTMPKQHKQSNQTSTLQTTVSTVAQTSHGGGADQQEIHHDRMLRRQMGPYRRLSCEQRNEKVRSIQQEHDQPSIEIGLVLIRGKHNRYQYQNNNSLQCDSARRRKASFYCNTNRPGHSLSRMSTFNPRPCRSFDNDTLFLHQDRRMSLQSIKNNDIEITNRDDDDEVDQVQGYGTDPEIIPSLLRRRSYYGPDTDCPDKGKTRNMESTTLSLLPPSFGPNVPTQRSFKSNDQRSTCSTITRSSSCCSLSSSQSSMESSTKRKKQKRLNNTNHHPKHNNNKNKKYHNREEKLYRDIVCNEWIIQQAQETFNVTWTLKWYKLIPRRKVGINRTKAQPVQHQQPMFCHFPMLSLGNHSTTSNSDDFNDSNGFEYKPITCKVWLERGGILRGKINMIEPSLKWKEVTIPKHMKHSRTTRMKKTQQNADDENLFAKPNSIPLLQMCRLLPGELYQSFFQQKHNQSQRTHTEGIHHCDNHDYDSSNHSNTTIDRNRNHSASFIDPGWMIRWNQSIVIRCNPSLRNNNNHHNGSSTNMKNSSSVIASTATTTGDSLTAQSNMNDFFIFEAPTVEIRDDILRRWKMSIARFASLAVLEDVDSILNEFFLKSSIASPLPLP